MKKLLLIFMLLPFLGLAQDGLVIEPRIDAQSLGGFLPDYYLDTTDFAAITIQHVNTAYVGSITSDGSIKAPFTTIQEGITSASSGDIVLVYPGSYTEHLTITTDSLKIIGYGANQTFLETTVTGGTGIALTDYTTFQGIKFTGDAAGAIIELDANETNVFIKDCIFDITGSNTFGISGGAAGSDSLFVENCTFYTNSGDGAIWLEKTNTNTVIDNNIFYGVDSTSGYAIQTAGIDGARFTNNQIEGFASGIFPHTVTTTSSGTYNVLIEGNTIKDCSKAIRLGHSSMTVDMDSMFVYNNTWYYNSFGIYIENDAQVLSGTFEVTGNTLAENTVNIRNDGTAPAYSANIENNHYVAVAAPVVGADLTNKTYVDAQITVQDLDFAGDAGTGDVDLDSQTFTIAGTANEIETAASGQALTIGLPTLTILPDGTTATTQSSGDNSTKVATTAYADGAVSGNIDFKVDATNPSQVIFIVENDTIIESFGHNHNQYLLKTGGTISSDVSITGNLDITGAFTVAEFTQYISIPSGQATVGGTAPAPTTIGTWRALRFNANAELAFIEFEIPDDWIGTSDMTIKIYGYPTSGDIVQAGEIIEFDAEYRSIAEGEAYDNGTSVTISPTYTQSGVGTDKALIELTVLIDFDNANQPLTKGDVVGIKCFRDVTTSDTYSGDFDVVKWEIQYQANTFPMHQN